MAALVQLLDHLARLPRDEVHEVLLTLDGPDAKRLVTLARVRLAYCFRDAPETTLELRVNMGDGFTPLETLVARITAGWNEVQTSPAEELETWAMALEHEARRLDCAALVAEVATLRAVRAALHFDPDTDKSAALRLVRRASRLTRTEGMPTLEQLANLALARMRRLEGAPHLGARILGSLLSDAPAGPWLRWEALLAGVRVDGPAEHIAIGTLSELLNSLSNRNSGEASLRGIDGLRKAVLGPLSRDITLIEQAFVPDAHITSDFRRGRRGLPNALRAMAALFADEFTHRAFILVSPTSGAVRVVNAGLYVAPGAHALLPIEGRRTVTALAVLATFPDGIEEAAYFRTVYGFEFDADKHRATFAVLLHRARAALGDYAVIVQTGTRYTLKCHIAFAIGDPRCALDDAERVLALIAEGSESAKAIAARAGLPLRSVQEVLKRLVEDGACIRRRSGRSIGYAIEDTTFREATTSSAAPELGP